MMKAKGRSAGRKEDHGNWTDGGGVRAGGENWANEVEQKINKESVQLIYMFIINIYNKLFICSVKICVLVFGWLFSFPLVFSLWLP